MKKRCTKEQVIGSLRGAEAGMPTMYCAASTAVTNAVGSGTEIVMSLLLQ